MNDMTPTMFDTVIERPTPVVKPKETRTFSEPHNFPQRRPPTWQPRWWHRSKWLDARAILWSLKNNPKDWKMEYRERDFFDLITHVPTGHKFRHYPGTFMGIRLHTAECSCHTEAGRKMQRGQRIASHRAVENWIKETGWRDARAAERKAEKQRRYNEKHAAHNRELRQFERHFTLNER